MRKISIFGSTGTVGCKMVKFVKEHQENFEVVGLACRQNYEKIIEQSKILRPKYVLIADKKAYEKVKEELETTVLPVNEICALAEEETDIVGMAMSGTEAIFPSLHSLGHTKILALANKESVVAGGDFFISSASQKGTKIVPVDSEHSAIFQCLEGENPQNVRDIVLTCSGGPCIDFSPEELANASPIQALQHPNWSMGQKITVDCATVMNKALELIEAAFLFQIDIKKVRAIVHRQSIVHGLVTFADSSIKALLGYPDMSLPVGYALSYPDRDFCDDFQLDLQTLSFEDFKPWQKRSLDCAYRAYAEKKCTVLNAINEKCVYDFLSGHIGFMDIQNIVENTLEKAQSLEISSMSSLADALAYAREICS